MSGIFISYRRDDSAASAGRLYDRLVNHFGRDRVFMDIEHIEPGEDFAEIIEKNLAAVDVAIILIGKQWLDIKDSTGRRRLDDPDDFVRLEIAAILDRKIRAIPVLVDNAVMPKASQLPDPLDPLVRRNALEISHVRFNSDVDTLIGTLGRIVVDYHPAPKPPKKSSSSGAIAAAVSVGILYFGAQISSSFLPQSDIPLSKAPENLDSGRAETAEVTEENPNSSRAETAEVAEENPNSSRVEIAEVAEENPNSSRAEIAEVAQLTKAATQGDADAQYNLGFMYDEGRGMPKDDKKAVEWYRKAAKQGNADAQIHLGFMYMNGYGVPQDDKKAVEWYRKAADQKHPIAQHNLGFMYDEGRGVPKDDKKAVEWYRKAAKQGDADAQYTLGIMYENGEGVPKDDKKALEWYRKAADQGHTDAQAALERYTQ